MNTYSKRALFIRICEFRIVFEKRIVYSRLRSLTDVKSLIENNLSKKNYLYIFFGAVIKKLETVGEGGLTKNFTEE